MPGLNLDTSVPLQGYSSEELALTLAKVVIILAGVRIAYLLVVLIYRLLVRKPLYQLVIETSGAQYAALTGTDSNEIAWVADQIIAAIEHPLSNDRVINIKSLDMRGSQGVQIGGHGTQHVRF